MMQKDVHVSGKQYYNSLDELWNAIYIAASHISKETIKVLTDSVDRGLLSVIKRRVLHQSLSQLYG